MLSVCIILYNNISNFKYCHIVSFFVVLQTINFKTMVFKHVIEKDIDEAKQGEVLNLAKNKTATKKMYIESYGCQMNFSDSEIVASILTKEGFSSTSDISKANLVFVNTCSIREKAEKTIRKRLEFYNSIKKNKNK